MKNDINKEPNRQKNVDSLVRTGSESLEREHVEIPNNGNKPRQMVQFKLLWQQLLIVSVQTG